VLSLRQVLVLGIGFLSLTACTGEVMQSRVDRPGVQTYFAQGASAGEMLTVVSGNPFPVSKAQLEQAVTEAMQGNHRGPRTHFSTQPGPEARRNHRIVMAFNTPKSFHIDNLCGTAANIPSEPAGEKLTLSAGYCVGDALYSHAKVSIPEPPSPNDPRFQHMVASAMWELVPSTDPFDDDDSSCVLPNC